MTLSELEFIEGVSVSYLAHQLFIEKRPNHPPVRLKFKVWSEDKNKFLLRTFCPNTTQNGSTVLFHWMRCRICLFKRPIWSPDSHLITVCKPFFLLKKGGWSKVDGAILITAQTASFSSKTCYELSCKVLRHEYRRNNRLSKNPTDLHLLHYVVSCLITGFIISAEVHRIRRRPVNPDQTWTQRSLSHLTELPR